MIRGLEVFKEHFASFSGNYVLIGGTACTLAMEEMGLDFRSTKDLDIVLCVEALETKFIEAFWEFVRAGDYQYQQQSTGKNLFYRFYGPKNFSYPQMLELFSRKPDAITLRSGGHLTPIPVSDEVSSLSAILLNDDYYQFIQAGKRKITSLSILGSTHLIPIKARAYLDLSSQRDSGTHIDEHDIRKHRNDIFRLYQLLSPDTRILLPPLIHQDMLMFLEKIKEVPVDLKAIGVRNTDLQSITTILGRVYCGR